MRVAHNQVSDYLLAALTLFIEWKPDKPNDEVDTNDEECVDDDPKIITGPERKRRSHYCWGAQGCGKRFSDSANLKVHKR